MLILVLSFAAQEAKQAAELMAVWAPIDTADALELLSPAFHNPEASAVHQPDPRSDASRRACATPMASVNSASH